MIAFGEASALANAIRQAIMNEPGNRRCRP
jgi:hypothetical protein